MTNVAFLPFLFDNITPLAALHGVILGHGGFDR